jgi:arsenite methyltransferase
MLGYPTDLVDAMPPAAVESFAGVGNPFSLGLPVSGDKVVDVGCGGGFDCFMAAQAVGPAGRVVGIDMTTAMVEKARHTARQISLPNVEFHQGLAEDIPLEAASMDVAISNGVINLCPDKHKVFREIFRVLRPGGRLCLSDIVVHRPVPDAARANVDLWTAWIGGALLEGEYLQAIAQAGFVDVELVSSVDVFAGSEGESNAHAFETMGVNIRARKPA